MNTQSPPRLIPPSVEDGRRLREFFAETGYNLDALLGDLGLSDLTSFRYRKFLFNRGGDLTTLDAMVRWFVSGVPILREQAEKVVPAWVIQCCESCGLLYNEGDFLRAAAMLSPFQDLLIASDLISKLDEDASDLIVWPNATTYQMTHARLPWTGGATLDLGCGMGTLAVTASPHSSIVVATDINPRAGEFTAFNARLNGVPDIEYHTGNCFEPVAGRRFDLILCNPPFFLVPSSGLLYCENPMELDSFARYLIREAPAYLNELGFFQMLCEWVDLEGRQWRERLHEWGEGIGCDVWMLKTYTMTPITYGKMRCEQRPGNRETGDAAFGDWVDYYKEKRVRAVHGGLVMLRKRSGKNWIRLDEDPTVTLASPVGDLFLAGFAAQDLIESDDQELLSAKLRLLDRARLRQFLRRQESKWVQTGLSLTAPGVFGRELEMEPLVAEFSAHFDGESTLDQLIGDLAQRVDADVDKVRTECLEIARKLLERGFLTR